MRSYPGLVTRVLREKAFRRPVSSVSVRSLGASTTSHHVGPAAAAAVATAGRARTGEGHVGALRQGFGEDGARWGSVCAASAAAVAVLGASDDKQPAAAAGQQQQQQRRREFPLPGGDLPVGRHAVADAVESASPWVVNIVSGSAMSSAGAGAMKWDDAGGVRNMGSGFVISGDGLVVTNAHVVERFADGAVVITLDGGDKLKKGKVQAMDRRFDLALVKVDVPPGHLLPVAEIGRSEALRAGEFVVAMGSPQGLSKSCTLGIVSATSRRRSELVSDLKTENIMSDSANFIQTDAAIASGNSGGPLIDLDGRVIGINTLKLSGTDGVGFAIPIDMAWQVIEELRTRGRVDRPQLGMRLVTTDNRDGTLNGVMILSVTPGGAADRAGLGFGDLITEFDGQAVTTTSEVLHRIGHQVGRAITMTVRPDGQQESDPPRRLTLVTESDLRPRPPAAANNGGGNNDGSGGGGGGGGSPSASLNEEEGAPATTLTG
ncbi:unnamed protein product [Pylaiella littoralis]